VPGSPHRATLEKPEAARRIVTAQVDDFADTADIWIVWVEMELRNSGMMSETNRPELIAQAFPRLGPMTDEAGDITHAESAGNVEIVGRILPVGAHTAVKGGWMFVRHISQVVCINGLYRQVDVNKGDPSDPLLMDLVPEGDDRIYDIDGPTSLLLTFEVLHTDETYDTFAEHVTWNGARASGDLEWHYQAWIDDDLDAANKPRNRDTVLNEVGPGALVLPQKCHFQPRP
jgi:hypothetical protein